MVELLVVIGIIGVLSGTVILVNPRKQLQRGNDGQRKADLVLISSALESYYQDIGDYPGAVNACIVLSSTGNTIKPLLEPNHVKKMPRDPKFSATTDYIYWHNAVGEYRLYAVLEDSAANSVLTNDGGTICTGTASHAAYNYKVTNP